jgi:hypothetical protein
MPSPPARSKRRAVALRTIRRIDEREARLGIEPALQMTGRLRDDDFERGANGAFNEVAAVRCGIRLSENNVRVHGRSTLLERDVADHREDLNLLVDPNVTVLLGGPLEVGYYGARERADGGEVTRSYSICVGERRESRHGFIVMIEDEHERPKTVRFIEQCDFHDAPITPTLARVLAMEMPLDCSAINIAFVELVQRFATH